MRVLLQDAQTGLYCAPNGGWVSNIAEALNFPDIETAAQHAFTSDRDTIDVVLKYETIDAELKLNPAYCTRRQPPRPSPPNSWPANMQESQPQKPLLIN